MIQVLIAIDQLFNALLGGYADETLSARAFRTSHWLEPVIDALFFWQDRHCYFSYLAEKQRKQLPKEYHGQSKPS